MASENWSWCRWHHGTVNDPKWRVVASRCVTSVTSVTNVTVGHVVAVWAAMVENASQSPKRGELAGWDDEDVAAGLGFTTEQVRAIREAMQGKTLEGGKLSGWEKRQPKREDSSAGRTKAWRERHRANGDTGDASVTHGDARDDEETHGDHRGEEKREEKEQKKSSSSGDDQRVAAFDARLAEVARDAIETWNESTLVTECGLPSVRAKVGFDKRKEQVRRMLRTARDICQEQLGSSTVTRQFWVGLWKLYAADEFYSGRIPGGKGHENWRPDFESLTQEKCVLRIYDRAAPEAPVAEAQA
ncbi:hypothetical protein [Lysobacter sp. GCM10012299]|uniref:hypothetical protein n=1 Tax=Lysobacter sp. GCM10012299 TaxID=3317333 RepID=UPI0036236F5C